jgi:hypothetical protein
MNTFGTGLGIFALIVSIVWLFFPFAVIHAFNKLRAANRLIVQHLEAIHHEMEEMNKRLDSANKMHGDLNRTAQWFVDREAEPSRESLPL